MPDLTQSILPRLQQHRLPELDLGAGMLYPNYHGYSILNLPSTICRMLGAPPLGAGALHTEILNQLGEPVHRVILVLMDGLSLHRFKRWMRQGNAQVWGDLLARGVFSPLTSITPSTTASALTSLWTGRSAAEHGILGYEMWLKEYGVVANMILHAPMSFARGSAGSLSLAGFEPQKFMPLRTLASHLAGFDIPTYAMQHHSIAYSGLSEMLLNGARVRAFGTAAELWVNLRRLVESPEPERFYTWVYWSEVDHFSHVYGPDDERTQAEFDAFSAAMQQYFLDKLPARARQDTLLLLAADHGHLTTQLDAHYELRRHPSLARRLHIQPSGENRLAYLFIKPGQIEAAREYLDRTWPGQFAWLDPVHAVQTGLFGPGALHPNLYDRLGDVVLVGRGGAYLWWADKDNPLIGRHGGLHSDEMLVPFLAVCL